MAFFGEKDKKELYKYRVTSKSHFPWISTMFVVFALICSYVSDICLRNPVTRAGEFQLFDLPCSIHPIHHHQIITVLLFGSDFPPVRSEWHFPSDKTDINNRGLDCKAVGFVFSKISRFQDVASECHMRKAHLPSLALRFQPPTFDVLKF